MTKKIAIALLMIAVVSTAAVAAQYPWADSIIHTNPVLERGLGPEAVTPGYQIVPLSNIGRDGEPVSEYPSWMTGRSGEKVYCRFRPGEAVEAICVGSTEVARGEKYWIRETWHAKRIVRCGNPTSVDFYCWKEKAAKPCPPPAPQVTVQPAQITCPPVNVTTPPVNNYNYNYIFTPAMYPSVQMMGVSGPWMASTQLAGVCWVQPASISNTVIAYGGAGGAGGQGGAGGSSVVGPITNTNNNSNSNANTNVNTNVVNVGDGSASGSGSGSSTAGSNAGK